MDGTGQGTVDHQGEKIPHGCIRDPGGSPPARRARLIHGQEEESLGLRCPFPVIGIGRRQAAIEDRQAGR